MSSKESIKWNADWKRKLIKNMNEFSIRQVHQWSPHKSVPTRWDTPSFLSPGDKFSNVSKVRKRLFCLKWVTNVVIYRAPQITQQSAPGWMEDRMAGSQSPPGASGWGGDQCTHPSDGTLTAIPLTKLCPITTSIVVTSESGSMLPDCLLIR